METINDLSVQEKVLQRIRDAILDGKFAPGMPLRIDTLAAELGVSHMPVREALHVLTVEGLATRFPRRGVIVSSLSAEDLARAYETMEVLEGLAARKAAECISQTEITALRKLLESSRQLAGKGDFAGLLVLNRTLHDRIYGASPNRWRDEFYRQLCNYIYRLRRSYPHAAKRINETMREHQGILDALESRDGELAERLVREHCRRSRDDLLEQLAAVNERKPSM